MDLKTKIQIICEIDSLDKGLDKRFVELCFEVYLRKDFETLLCMVSSQAQIWLFIELQEELDDPTYFRLLGKIMTLTYISFDPKFFMYLLECPNRDPSLRKDIMTTEEQAVLEGLPSEITIFRGNAVSKRVGYSWSLSEKRAIPFAQRHFPNSGELLVGSCHKTKILAYFSREEEVLIHPQEVVIQSRMPIAAGKCLAVSRINHHFLVWSHMRKSVAFIKIKEAIDNLV